ncbi:MAG: copper oxidase [Phormidesmis priestleyi]|uniref:Copper oxidase n=1 Tax=Phormidesmis priestleyi TaxID=268141 RepID=A0A2W4XH04_9CYAN|nr:MAG: copper oxidase [Phormidesmis priestleyi]
MKRRQFNRQFVGSLAAAASVPLLSQCDGKAPPKKDRNNAAKRSPTIKRISSVEGLLELSLTAKAQTQTIAGESLKLLAYNGQVPGPILEARAGDTVRLTLINALGNPTNLHYHGLHISPEVDNVFREVAEGERYTYEFQIPETHPAVTGWYHPHYHLKVASQVFDGLAGPMIIRGALDDIPEIKQAEEALLVLKDFEPKLQGGGQTLSPLAKRWGREGSLLTANAQRNPVVDISQNGLLRLRLINASASRIYQLQLPEHPWFLMATDRGAISEPTEIETLMLSPGERAELLIPGSREPGDYEILSLPYDRGLSEMIESMGKSAEQMPGIELPKKTAIATLQYRPSDRTEPLPLPTQLIPVESLPEPEISREFVLDHGIDHSAKSTGFIINGQSFMMDRVNTRVRLNQVEDWHIINRASMAHPFHLHTNRFQVIKRNGKPEPFRAWKNTVAIGSYETVILRVKFEDFAGRTVYHCHILDHEDQGMMGIVDIQT